MMTNKIFKFQHKHTYFEGRQYLPPKLLINDKTFFHYKSFIWKGLHWSTLPGTNLYTH